MTNWTPELSRFSGPRYRRIADAIAADVGQGYLAPGTRMPTQRDLAWRLGMTIGTVTRAYAEAENRGLITGEVGRGTFVREPVPDHSPLIRRGVEDENFIELAQNFPRYGAEHRIVADCLSGIAADGLVPALMEYQSANGRREHRRAAVKWLELSGLSSDAEEIVISSGAQHGMFLAVSALTQPGDVILTEDLTFYGIKTIASTLGLRLYGLGMDEEGLTPEALDAACRNTGAKVLYTIPTLQNPTTAVMSDGRRQAIADVCRRHDVAIIEDDVYGLLLKDTMAPLSTYAPERSLYVTSLSKCVAAGLRIGYVKAPKAWFERVCHAVKASTIMVPPIMAEAASRLIEDGKAEQLLQWQRSEAAARQSIVRDYLPGSLIRNHPEAFHLWLSLPPPWRREFFTLEARDRGVGVGSAELFAVGQQPVPQAVRICLQAARDRSELTRALKILAEVLEQSSSVNVPIV